MLGKRRPHRVEQVSLRDSLCHISQVSHELAHFEIVEVTVQEAFELFVNHLKELLCGVSYRLRWNRLFRSLNLHLSISGEITKLALSANFPLHGFVIEPKPFFSCPGGSFERGRLVVAAVVNSRWLNRVLRQFCLVKVMKSLRAPLLSRLRPFPFNHSHARRV